jgi:uncharacterized membrane protein YhaH (DUF805 family)
MIARGFFPDIQMLVSVVLVPFIVVFVLLLLLAIGISRFRDRKNRLLVSLILLAAAILSGLVPALFPGGIPDNMCPVFMVSGVLVVPLAVIMPGILWFWPEERTFIVRDTLLCSVLSLVLGIAIAATVILAVPEPAIVSAWSEIMTVLAGLPAGLSVALVLVFSSVFILSCAGYRILGKIIHRAVPRP